MNVILYFNRSLVRFPLLQKPFSIWTKRKKKERKKKERKKERMNERKKERKTEKTKERRSNMLP